MSIFKKNEHMLYWNTEPRIWIQVSTVNICIRSWNSKIWHVHAVHHTGANRFGPSGRAILTVRCWKKKNIVHGPWSHVSLGSNFVKLTCSQGRTQVGSRWHCTFFCPEMGCAPFHIACILYSHPFILLASYFEQFYSFSLKMDKVCIL